MIKVIYKEPEKNAKAILIENSHESMQLLVNGYIEYFPTAFKDLFFVVNEEGKLRGLEPNIYAPNLDDLLVGNVLIVGINKNGEQRSLKKAEIDGMKQYMNSLERMLHVA